MGTHKSSWFDWNDENCNRLRAMYAEGLSASEIATELGISDRGAVCGKIHRLGLTRTFHNAPARKPHPKHKPAPRRHAPFRATPARPPPPAPESAPEVNDLDIPISQRRTLEQLTSTTCRWPVGHPGAPDFFFCGHDSADLNIGIPYCATHAKRATQGSPPARPYIPMRNDRV